MIYKVTKGEEALSHLKEALETLEMAIVRLSNIHAIHAPLMQTSGRILTPKGNCLRKSEVGFQIWTAEDLSNF